MDMPTPTVVTPSRVFRPQSSVDRAAFAEFGAVVERQTFPAADGKPDAKRVRPLKSVKANQGTATKYLNVTFLDDHYATQASSGKAANSVVNMFVCEPRQLRDHAETRNPVFPVEILERHPYTSQTFIPLGIAPDDTDARYLVIVAPTLPTSPRGKGDTAPKPYPTPAPRRRRTLKERLLGARPNPFTNDHTPTTTPRGPLFSEHERRPKGRGLPDLDRLQAFIVRGDQAITYGPGTWHAPMVVLGSKPIPFVVVQYANGVEQEDCQEVLIRSDDGGEGTVIEVGNSDEQALLTGAGIMRAKL